MKKNNGNSDKNKKEGPPGSPWSFVMTCPKGVITVIRPARALDETEVIIYNSDKVNLYAGVCTSTSNAIYWEQKQLDVSFANKLLT